MRFFSREETVATQWRPPRWRHFTSIALFNLTTSLPVSPPNRTAGGLNQPRATISFLPSPSLPSDPWRATEARQIPAASSRQNAASSSHYRIPYTNLTGRGLIFFLPFCRLDEIVVIIPNKTRVFPFQGAWDIVWRCPPPRLIRKSASHSFGTRYPCFFHIFP